MDQFILNSKYTPAGDQPKAIDKLVQGIQAGDREQTLLGVTGSGKTFTMANIIARLNRPTLVLAHNKTLAAQLCSEFREFFLIMQSNISSPIMITINPKRILCKQIPILKKILPLMMK